MDVILPPEDDTEGHFAMLNLDPACVLSHPPFLTSGDDRRTRRGKKTNLPMSDCIDGGDEFWGG